MQTLPGSKQLRVCLGQFGLRHGHVVARLGDAHRPAAGVPCHSKNLNFAPNYLNDCVMIPALDLESDLQLFGDSGSGFGDGFSAF